MKISIIRSATAVVALLVVLGSLAHAGDQRGHVRTLYVTESGSIYVTLETAGGVLIDPLCTGASSHGHIGTVTPTHASDNARDMMLKMLTAAKLAGKQVRLLTNDNAGGYGCRVNRVYLEE